MIEYFVDVAKECVNIGNFNSLMAIIGKLSDCTEQSQCDQCKLWPKIPNRFLLLYLKVAVLTVTSIIVITINFGQCDRSLMSL